MKKSNFPYIRNIYNTNIISAYIFMCVCEYYYVYTGLY